MNRPEVVPARRRLLISLAAVARRKALEEAADAGWPLPEGLRVHLWLYVQGLSGPTRPRRRPPTGLS